TRTAGTRTGDAPVDLVYDAPAAPGREGRRRLPLRRRSEIQCPAICRGVPRARVRARQLVRDVGDLAAPRDRSWARCIARNRLARRATGPAPDPRGRPHFHPAALAGLAQGAAGKARPGRPRGDRTPDRGGARGDAALRRVRLCYYESGLCEGRRRSLGDRPRRAPGGYKAASTARRPDRPTTAFVILSELYHGP